MNNKPEGPPERTSFDAPDISSLYQRSQELAARTKVVCENMTEISRRMHEAIARGDQILREMDQRER